ncbi:MAG: ABC transporter permease [Acidobacteria bacterium]|nr:ABC transporter permease [Acidobacteriota bacterium]
MRTLLQDIRYGARLLIKQPAFTVIAVLTLALGIGANTAIFTVVNAALLRGLPYRDPERLVHLWETTPQKDFPRREASYPDYEDWKQNQVFTGLTAYAGCGMVLTGREAPEAIPCARVAADFFSVLGVEPILGRAFQAGEDQPGAPKVVVLSYGAWQRRFGGGRNIIGRTLRLNDDAWTIIGILPESFHFAPRGASEMWAPLNPNEMQRTNRRAHWVNIVARLKPEVSSARAEAEMNTIARRIAEQYPETHANTGNKLVPLQEEIIGDVKPLLLALVVAVGLVLLIACVNVANLLLARAASRQKEIAIRLALGAGRGRVVRQFLTECLLLALVGGAIGLLFAEMGVRALITAIPDVRLSAMPYLRELSIDRSILAFTSGLALLTGIVFGLAPALQASGTAMQGALKEGGRTAAGTGSPRLRQLLVVAEIALALVLLIGAGLMMKSLVRLLQVDPGFNAKNLLMHSITVTGDKYKDEEARTVFHRQLLARLESLPGVKGVATVDVIPLVGGNTTRCYVASRPVPPPGEEAEANTRTVSANYFRVMEVPLIKGRYFTERDNRTSPLVIIINQTLARRLLPNEEAVGQRLIFPGDARNAYEIIGVVGDEKLNGLAAKTTSVVYGPYQQDADRSTVLMIRTEGEPMNLAETVRRETRALEPGTVAYFTRSMDNIISNLPATFIRRYPALLMGIFAVLALLLATVGIYGVMSFTVAHRTHEIGVRMALGAQRRDVLKLIVRQGLNLALIGVVIGLIAAFALTRLMTSLLFSVSATDPTTFVLIALLLIAVSLLACYVPARRATKVDPMVALRYE